MNAIIYKLDSSLVYPFPARTLPVKRLPNLAIYSVAVARVQGTNS